MPMQATEVSLPAFLEAARTRVETALERWLPAAERPPADLHQAMRYATLGNGKRLRPVLVYAAGRALGAPLEALDIPACAVELVHAYSLVHDDLPAMDDDDLRRGMPSCHCRFGEALAILAGDALQSLAFQVLTQGDEALLPGRVRARMAALLAEAAGAHGMAGGQALDLAAVGQDITPAELENMHIHKTGALIRASVRLGALCAPQPDPERLAALDHYGKCIGLAFQIQDDILDATGNTASLGKEAGADRARAKPTYASLLGLDAARDEAAELVRNALRSLEVFDPRAEPLRALARYVVERHH